MILQYLVHFGCKNRFNFSWKKVFELHQILFSLKYQIIFSRNRQKENNFFWKNR